MARLLVLAALFGGFFNFQLKSLFEKSSAPSSPVSKVVCLDPGHGGDDTGALSYDITEEDEALDIAGRLKMMLGQARYRVVMTRVDNSTNPTNSERAGICNSTHADILVSIHLNSNYDNTLNYTQGLYGQDSKDQKLTEDLHSSLVSTLGLGDGDITDFEDNLLLKALMPATLQETVFMSSDDEYKLLTEGGGRRQQQIAQALFKGIDSWFHPIPPPSPFSSTQSGQVNRLEGSILNQYF